MDSKELIRNFIRENFLFDSDDAKIDEEDSFLENGIVDSTGILELVSFVEDEFGIEVKDEELVPDNFDSIAKLAGFIERKKG
ncbi:MAG: acyl carrier protein [Candidatus Latescibacteria bacterium 4484_7]|nr:MAG: acyl carrier protein [Candidatus Latescibacteria bacterium 4484_7]RKZ09190.1 MAG: acyl carrier protein [bacterium]